MFYHTRLIESFSNANARMLRMVHSMVTEATTFSSYVTINDTTTYKVSSRCIYILIQLSGYLHT